MTSLVKPAFNVNNFFINVNINDAQCKICKKIYLGNKKFNKERHVIGMHKEHVANSKFQSTASQKRLSDSTAASSARKRSRTEEYKLSCVEMMALDGVSFRFFEGSGFRRLHSQIPSNFTANRSNVVDWIDEAASYIRATISAELKGRMFTLSADMASRFGHSILGVTAQFIENGKMIHRVLGMVPLANRHTAVNIADEINLVLAVYDREIIQIYTLGIDNANNIVNAGELLSDHQKEQLRKLIQDLSSSNNGEYQESDILFAGYGEKEAEIDEKLVNQPINNSCLQVMRCSAHTVNLAIKDAVKRLNCETELKLIRALVRKAKAVVFRPIFKMNAISVPVLDCDTRWGTTATMLESVIGLLGLEPELQAVDRTFVVDTTLIEFAKMYSEAFKPITVLLKNLQKPQLTVGDMFRYYWIETRRTLKSIAITNRVAAALLLALKERKDKLFENNAFVAGLFMDPRFNFLNTPYFTPIQKQQAIDHLLATWRMMQLNKAQAGPNNDGTLDQPNLSDMDKFILEDCDQQCTAPAGMESKLQRDLHGLCTKPRQLIELDVLQYWVLQEIKEPLLYELSKVALCAAPTSVPVERAFSGLVHELTASRSNMSSETVDNLMIIRLNRELLESAF